MMKADNDNSDTWLQLAALTANVVRYLELKETTPAKQRELCNSAAKHSVPVIVKTATRLAVQDKGTEKLHGDHAAKDVLRNAHASDPHEKGDKHSEGEPDASSADEKRKEREREYIDHRLKEIRSWEKRIGGNKN